VLCAWWNRELARLSLYLSLSLFLSSLSVEEEEEEEEEEALRGIRDLKIIFFLFIL